jgi:hypothetical protein
MAKRDIGISSRMRELGDQLREFREGHAPRTRLPEELWAVATSVARDEGVYRTARTLHLDYANLRRRVESWSGRRARSSKSRGLFKRTSSGAGRADAAKKRDASAAFVELLGESIASRGATAADCLIEVESTGGARMRIRMMMSTPEVVSLVREWRDRGAETDGERQA